MEKKLVNIQKFVKDYVQLQDISLKQKMVEGIITRNYSPILEKKVVLQNLFDKAIFEEDGIQYVDSFLLHVNKTHGILALYTNLDIKKNEKSETNGFDDYDDLIESGAFDMILGLIGTREINEFNIVLKHIEETFYNKQTTENFIAKQVTRFGNLISFGLGSGLEQLSEILKDKDMMKNVVSELKRFVKSFVVLTFKYLM